MDRTIIVADDGDRPYGVELVDVEVEGVEGDGGTDGRLTSPTGLREAAARGSSELASLLARIAADLGRELASIDEDARPSSVEAEVHLGLSAQVGPVWLVTGKGDYSLRATFVWTT